MRYVFDSGPLITLFTFYYRDRFPSLWKRFENLIEQNRVISVREVMQELSGSEGRLAEWVNENSHLFTVPTSDELEFVAGIFKISHFQTLIRKQERLQGKPVADPFVIARAHVIDGCVVTTEKHKPNAARIPNVCNHFNVRCLSLEKFMEEENWQF